MFIFVLMTFTSIAHFAKHVISIDNGVTRTPLEIIEREEGKKREKTFNLLLSDQNSLTDICIYMYISLYSAANQLMLSNAHTTRSFVQASKFNKIIHSTKKQLRIEGAIEYHHFMNMKFAKNSRTIFLLRYRKCYQAPAKHSIIIEMIVNYRTGKVTNLKEVFPYTDWHTFVYVCVYHTLRTYVRVYLSMLCDLIYFCASLIQHTDYYPSYLKINIAFHTVLENG